jgi:hypothetical protein
MMSLYKVDVTGANGAKALEAFTCAHGGTYLKEDESGDELDEGKLVIDLPDDQIADLVGQPYISQIWLGADGAKRTDVDIEAIIGMP